MIKNKLTGSTENIDRCSGKSTAQALGYIKEAILIGNPIKVKDHYGTIDADRLLLMKCKEIVDKLGLKEFSFSFLENTMSCELFEEVK
jgi:hypothetical protein